MYDDFSSLKNTDYIIACEETKSMNIYFRTIVEKDIEGIVPYRDWSL